MCSTDRIHPDDARFVRSYPWSGTGPDDVFCYTGRGAALNDLNGHERDENAQYYNDTTHCHLLQSSGYEVPGAKRPATRSLPAPGSVNVRSPIQWRPVSSNFNIANGGGLPALQTFTDREAFIADTGAISASGDLPDLGQVADRVTIGSITLSLALGANTIFVGASGTGAEPDWYPLLPGNDIALGVESLQVQTAAPVYALGFDFAEPDATMPSYGGTPVDSTFDVVLYSGSTEVGRTSFNADDDVAAFVGIWSERSFDRATIVDRTGNADDEFFGSFYTGLLPKP